MTKLGNLTDLSRQPGMPSLPTLREMIYRHRDFPIIERGNRGRSYVIDLDAAEHFVRALSEAPRLDRERRMAAIRMLGLSFLAEQESAK